MNNRWLNGGWRFVWWQRVANVFQNCILRSDASVEPVDKITAECVDCVRLFTYTCGNVLDNRAVNRFELLFLFLNAFLQSRNRIIFNCGKK